MPHPKKKPLAEVRKSYPDLKRMQEGRIERFHTDHRILFNEVKHHFKVGGKGSEELVRRIRSMRRKGRRILRQERRILSAHRDYKTDNTAGRRVHTLEDAKHTLSNLEQLMGPEEIKPV